jgi:hypothetical protein
MRNGRAGMADTTDFSTKCQILADLWMEYRDDEAFKELLDYADLGFPIAYLIDNGIIENSQSTEPFIESTFDLLLKLLKVEDIGFEHLNHLFEVAEENDKLN